MRYMLLAVCSGICLQVSPPFIQAESTDPFPRILTLGEALEIRDRNHPHILQSQASVALANARIAALGAENVLDVFLRGELRSTDKQGSPGRDYVDDSRVTLVIDKPLADFGATRMRRSALDAGVSAAQAGRDLAEAQNRLEVIRAFLDVIVADYAYIAADETMTLAYLTFNRQREARERFGEVSEVDVAALESIYLDRYAARGKVAHEQRSSRLRLALALNRPDAYPDQMVEPDISSYDRPLPDYEEMLTSAIQGSKILAAARNELQAARSRLQAASREMDAELGLRFEATGYAEQYGNFRDTLRGSLYLNLPLRSSAKRQGEIERLAAEVTRREAVLADQQQQIRIRLLELIQQLAGLELEINAARAELEYRELDLDRTRMEYEMEVRARIGSANEQVARALHRNMELLYDRVMVWEQIDAMVGAVPVEH